MACLLLALWGRRWYLEMPLNPGLGPEDNITITYPKWYVILTLDKTLNNLPINGRIPPMQRNPQPSHNSKLQTRLRLLQHLDTMDRNVIIVTILSRCFESGQTCHI